MTREEESPAKKSKRGKRGGGKGSADAPLAGPIATARDILETDGPKGFAAGSVTRGLYWAPAIGIFLSLYCSLRQLALTLLPPS